MERLCLVMVLFTYIFLQHSSGIAAYVVCLKNGREIATEDYWNEGHEVKLRFRDGIIGIPRKEILSVTERDIKIYYGAICTGSKEEPMSEGSKVDEKGIRAVEKIDQDSENHYLEKKKILKEKQTKAWSDYVKLGDRSSEERRQAREKAMEIDRQLKELEQELKRKAMGTLTE